MTKEGKEIQKRRYYFSETFAAIGCAEYYKATDEKQALRSAEDYFDVAYECFPGVRKTEPKFNPNNQCLKALSPVMIMLSTAQTMRSLGVNSERYSKIARECLNDVQIMYHRGVVMAAVTICLIPLFVLYVVMQRKFVEGVERSGLTGE